MSNDIEKVMKIKKIEKKNQAPSREKNIFP